MKALLEKAASAVELTFHIKMKAKNVFCARNEGL
jgi:hypothetical protein